MIGGAIVAAEPSVHKERESGVVGFGVLDDKGRLSLSKPVRQALGVQPGSSLAYVLVDHTLMLIPQDEHLAKLLDRSTQAMERAGLTVENLLDELPAARDEIMRETYGADFMDALAQEHAALKGRETDPDRGA